MRKFVPILAQICLCALTSVFALNAKAAEPTKYLWHVRKTHWAPEDEKAYENFVRVLGETKCNTVSKCLQDPANPFLKVRPALPPLSVDCSKLPYFIRAYFAWANDLPFSFVTEVESAGGASADLRYSKMGNRVVARKDVLDEPGKAPNVVKVLNYINNFVASSVYRVDPASESENHYSDFYPVRLAPGSIRPGTIFYDADGHLVLVYKIESDGRILYMDSHPDNSLTRGTYGSKFSRSNPRMGGGFKNWRPIVVENAKLSSNGNFVGGKIRIGGNDNIPDYSLEQFMGTNPDPSGDWKKGSFVYRGRTLPYLEYLRAVLTQGQFKLNPVSEFKNGLTELCVYLGDRVASVEQAVVNGLDRASHPGSIPTNIFGAEGDWETYSTASRDLRVRTMYRDLVGSASQLLARLAARDPVIDYQGTDLKADLAQVYRDEVNACTIVFKNSKGQERRLSLDEIRTRVFEMSFDPYDCVERRWGATDTQELATCTNDGDKESWFRKEKPMRRLQTRVHRIDEATAQDFLTDSDLDMVKVIGP